MSTPEQKALRILYDLFQRHANNLAAGSQDRGKAKVATGDWAAMLRQNGVPLEAMETLGSAGWVATDGTCAFINEAYETKISETLI